MEKYKSNLYPEILNDGYVYCPNCNGNGSSDIRNYTSYCLICGGYGKVTWTEMLLLYDKTKATIH